MQYLIKYEILGNIWGNITKSGDSEASNTCVIVFKHWCKLITNSNVKKCGALKSFINFML